MNNFKRSKKINFLSLDHFCNNSFFVCILLFYNFDTNDYTRGFKLLNFIFVSGNA